MDEEDLSYSTRSIISKLKSFRRYHKNYKEQGHWKSRKKMVAGANIGFTYIAHLVKEDTYYIGYKKFYHKKTRTVKGKKKKFFVESDWLDYTSSSKNVNEYLNEGNVNFYHVASWENLGALVYHEYHLMARFNCLMGDTFVNGFSPKMFGQIGKAKLELEQYFSKWGSL